MHEDGRFLCHLPNMNTFHRHATYRVSWLPATDAAFCGCSSGLRSTSTSPTCTTRRHHHHNHHRHGCVARRRNREAAIGPPNSLRRATGTRTLHRTTVPWGGRSHCSSSRHAQPARGKRRLWTSKRDILLLARPRACSPKLTRQQHHSFHPGHRLGPVWPRAAHSIVILPPCRALTCTVDSHGEPWP